MQACYNTADLMAVCNLLRCFAQAEKVDNVSVVFRGTHFIPTWSLYITHLYCVLLLSSCDSIISSSNCM